VRSDGSRKVFASRAGALDAGEQRDREVPCVPAAELTELIL
jgi:hypothetical protein